MAQRERTALGLRGFDPKSWYGRLAAPGDVDETKQLQKTMVEMTQLVNGPRCTLINSADRMLPPRAAQEVPREGFEAVMASMGRRLNRQLRLLASELQAAMNAD